MSADGIDARLRKRDELLIQVQGFMSPISTDQRAYNQTPARILQYVVAAKRTDQTDKKLCSRILISVKDCRKRMNAKGA